MSIASSHHLPTEVVLEMTSSKPISADGTFTLFVVLPTDRVCTLRCVQSGTSVEQVKGRLELAAGLPSYIYMLAYPDGECLSDRERLLNKENVRDGYLLRVHINENWESLYNFVIKNNIEHVYHSGGIHLKGNISISSDEAEKLDTMVNERAATALFIACYQGFVTMCNMLVSVGVDVNSATKFGRTAMHAAVCKDNISIVSVLFEWGCIPNTLDIYGQSPADVAKSFNSLQCEKKLRLMQINLRGFTQPSDSRVHAMDTRYNRISSVPYRSSEDGKLPGKTVRPKTTSVSGVHMRRPKTSTSLISFDSKLKQDVYSFVNKYDLNGKRKMSTSEGYWVIQRNDSNKASSNGFEKRLLRLSDSNCINVNNKQLPISLNTYNVIKCQKDASNLNPKHQDIKHEQESCMTPVITSPPTVSSMSGHDSATCQTHEESKSDEQGTISPNVNEEGRQGGSLQNGNEPNITNDVDDTQSQEDSPKSSGGKTVKTVRFSAKARSVRTLPRPETLETFRRMKRKINITIGTNNADSAKSHVPKSGGITFEKWYRRKKRLERKIRENESSSSEDDSDNEGDSEAFKEWMKKKKEQAYGPPKRITRPISNLIKIGSTELGEGRNPDPSQNIRAYRQWVDRKKKSRKGPNIERMKTVEDFMTQKTKLEEKRQQLLMDAISFDDWMNHTEEKKIIIKEILRADLDRLHVIEQEHFLKRTPRQLTHGDWRTLANKRQEENRNKLELQLKYEEEQKNMRKELLRTSAAIPHNEWLKLKRLQNQHSDQKANTTAIDMRRDADKTCLETEKTYENWLNRKMDENDEEMRSQIRQEQDLINSVRQKRINALVACQ